MFVLFLCAVLYAEDINMIELGARWVSKNCIVWNPKHSLENNNVFLVYSNGMSQNEEKTNSSAKSYLLQYKGSLDENIDSPLAYISSLYGTPCWDTSFFSLEEYTMLLKGKLSLVMKDTQNNIIESTGIQLAGILDDLYYYDGQLGLFFINNRPWFRLWAPTAQRVSLYIYENATSETPIDVVEMDTLELQTFDGDPCWTGVWEYHGDVKWVNAFYLYCVEVYVPKLGHVVKNIVTDPYSIALSVNSTKSCIVNLEDPKWIPERWNQIKPVSMPYPNAIYELHVRDFSIADNTVDSKERGTYLAFTNQQSAGMKHLKQLANAGLSHIHLLPTFDIATIEEDRSKQICPVIPKDSAPDSEEPQAIIAKIANQDAYNWGYDPLHYMVPEGSYALQAEGGTRILEFRKMILGLYDIGLRVILDMVFNHTHAAGQDKYSILDKIVPGYYYRLDDQGNVPCSTCCPDTASEHRMMEKLMLDTVSLWAVQYKVGGFRFDLMGHHTTNNMRFIREILDYLPNGIGKNLYIYGEGWKFGSLDARIPTLACNQENSYGLGIGTFNDRMRDSVRGGNPFADLAAQGFATGLYYDYNNSPENREIPKDKEVQKKILGEYTDNIRLSLAGNLRDYTITNSQGKKVTGKELLYRGSTGAGYTANATECINYVSIHDNHTLWDAIQAKAPFQNTDRKQQTATIKERIDMHKLSLALVLLGQGIPEFQAGDDMLRSKSGDCDSYNSGDYFNALDFSYHTNGWGKGLPIAEKNMYAWSFWKPRLASKELAVSEKEILDTAQYFQALLKIRSSSPLFFLKRADEIKARVRFLNAENGAMQIPGLIAMYITDDLEERPILDNKYSKILCFFFCGTEAITFQHEALNNELWKLHSDCPNQNNVESYIENGIFTIPARSVLVYYSERKNEKQSK